MNEIHDCSDTLTEGKLPTPCFGKSREKLERRIIKLELQLGIKSYKIETKNL